MTRIAITGGLCSGKTTLSALLRERGCPVADADRLGRELLQTQAKAALLARFGTAILDAVGHVEPACLADRVFAHGQEAALADLNRIMHPLILAAAEQQLQYWQTEGADLAGVEAALLIEEKLLAGFDCVVLVVAEVETRIQRFRERGGSREQALARMARQLPDERKQEQADRVMDNNGSPAALVPQVERLLRDLRSGAGA
ncbi:MAG: dephospho-CoA kinase [Terriglobales bacterium]